MQQKPTALYVLRILYFAMLGGILVFGGALCFISLRSGATIADKDLGKTLLVFSLMLSFLCLVVSGKLSKKSLAQIQEMNTLSEKLEKYRAVAIRNYALTEGPALFAIIAFFLTHKWQLLAVIALMIISFLLQFPSAKKVASQIGEATEDVESFLA